MEYVILFYRIFMGYWTEFHSRKLCVYVKNNKVYRNKVYSYFKIRYFNFVKIYSLFENQKNINYLIF